MNKILKTILGSILVLSILTAMVTISYLTDKNVLLNEKIKEMAENESVIYTSVMEQNEYITELEEKLEEFNNQEVIKNDVETGQNNVETENIVEITGSSAIFNCSAYTAGESGVNNTTASGETTVSGITVAMGSSYAFGTQIYIPALETENNDGIYTVQDRGGAISDNCIDIYFDTIDECNNFGRQDLEVYILD